MAYTYRLCITEDKNNQAPFPSLDEFNYNPEDWELLRRTYKAGIQEDGDVGMPFGGVPFKGLPKNKKSMDSAEGVPISVD